MKYEPQSLEIGNLLASAKNILITLPAEASVDDLAAGLALYLSLEQANKNPYIVTEGVIRVGHSHLFGIGQVQNKLPQLSGGNFVITLGGVVVPDASGQGSVPALEKLNWYPQGNDLNLVFHVVPGQKFEPTHITPRYEGGGLDLIFVMGVTSLDKLGSIYTQNLQLFANTPIIDIDTKQENMRFGKVNIVDPDASSVSEIVAQVLPGLQLPFETDIASNVLAGIFATTNNLQSPKVTADTFAVIASAMRVGGKKPIGGTTAPTPQVNQPQQSAGTNLPWINPTPQQQGGSMDAFAVPPVVSENPQQQNTNPAAEETPSGEVAKTSPEADWLTPKIFKGSNLG